MRETVKVRGRKSAEQKKPSVFWLIAGLVLPLWSCMVRYRFTPESKLPKTGAFVLAPNHYSEIDPVVVGVSVWHLGRLPRFLAKASLFRIPVAGKLLTASGQIPVERESRSREGSGANPLNAARELAERQAGVIVYPEGTLTRDPDLWPMRGKTGAVRLALEAGVPLIPMAHWGTNELMPRYSKKIHPFPRKTIHVAVGEPMDLSAYQGMPVDGKMINEITDKLMVEITKLLTQLRDDQPPAERWDPSKHQQSETGRF